MRDLAPDLGGGRLVGRGSWWSQGKAWSYKNLLWRPAAGDASRSGDKQHTILETIELSDAPWLREGSRRCWVRRVTTSSTTRPCCFLLRLTLRSSPKILSCLNRKRRPLAGCERPIVSNSLHRSSWMTSTACWLRRSRLRRRMLPRRRDLPRRERLRTPLSATEVQQRPQVIDDFFRNFLLK